MSANNPDKEVILAETRARLADLKGCIKPASLFTDAEWYFYEDLVEYLVGTEYAVFAKVALSRDLVNIRDISKNGIAQQVFEGIKRMHVDFVVIDGNGKVVRCFELDGSEHYRDEQRMKADALKETVLETAGIPLTRVAQNFNRYEFDFLETAR
jgi:hypothetical protein